MVGYIRRLVEDGNSRHLNCLLRLFPGYARWISKDTGETLLHSACRSFYTTHSTETLEVLLKHGADANVVSYDGRSPLFILGKYSVHMAGRDSAITTLKKYGAKPDLNAAILLCDSDSVKTILAKTPDAINECDPHGDSPLLNSIMRRSYCPEIFELLIKNGVEIDPFSAIHLKDLEYFRGLIREKPELTAFRKQSGISLLSEAVILGKKELANFLVENGASISQEFEKYRDFSIMLTVAKENKQLAEQLLADERDRRIHGKIGAK